MQIFTLYLLKMLLITAKPAFLLRFPWNGSLSPGLVVFVGWFGSKGVHHRSLKPIRAFTQPLALTLLVFIDFARSLILAT